MQILLYIKTMNYKIKDITNYFLVSFRLIHKYPTVNKLENL